MTAPERWAFYFRFLTDKEKRDKINEIIECEEGIAMASKVLMTISRDEVERARLESEYKYELDTQSRITYARQEGWQERNMEILNLIKAGCSLEEIEARLKAGGGS
jgi:DNA-binding NarL/FixJ family response regulator